MKLVTVAEMQKVEREANSSGFTYEMMMEHAGQNLARAVIDSYDLIGNKSALGLIGSGNNGGDTLVALASLAEQEWKTTAYIVRPRPEDDPLVSRFIEAGGTVYSLEEGDLEPDGRLKTLVDDHAVLLDGVLGTGFRLPLKSELAEVLDAVRQMLAEMASPPFVVAVDVPSGVDCDSGEAAPECIPADLTVTMAAVKSGLLKFPAFKYIGDLQVVDIGLPEGGQGYKSWKSIHRSVADRDTVRDSLPHRPADAHKGTFGTVFGILGSINYTGAALLAGEAAYRIGAGLVTLAVPAPLHTILAGQFVEATWVLLPHEMGVISENAEGVVRKNLGRATSLLFGCGFGLEETTRRFIERLIGASSPARRAGIGFQHEPEIGKVQKKEKESGAQLPPLVVDADGLKLLAKIPDWFTYLPAPAVLTPHPGEMSVLTGIPADEIQADRIGTAERFAKEWGHVVVLKGAFTVVASPDGQTTIIPVASAALARAGTGDVLAGLITGLRAQGLEAYPAAVAGAWIHAQAGLQAAVSIGNTASVLAGDILEAVSQVLTDYDLIQEN
ncbi:MAG: NAD(P)H-hydrate epimerase [Omnitrophica WOR_2 bacterium]